MITMILEGILIAIANFTMEIAIVITEMTATPNVIVTIRSLSNMNLTITTPVPMMPMVPMVVPMMMPMVMVVMVVMMSHGPRMFFSCQ